MNSVSPAEERSGTVRRQRGAVSGSAVVALIFTFGAVATGTLWTCWYYHTAPFIPFQKAIADEFEASAPRVDGGTRRIHKGTQSHLWVIMRVEFDVEEKDARVHQTVNRVVELAAEHLDLSIYDQINVRLFRGEPERYLHKRDVEVPVVDGEPRPESGDQDQPAES